MNRRNFLQLLGLSAAAAMLPLPDNAELLSVESLPAVSPREWFAHSVEVVASRPGPVFLCEGDHVLASLAVPYSNLICSLNFGQCLFLLDPAAVRVEAPEGGSVLVRVRLVGSDEGIKTITELVENLGKLQKWLLLTNQGHRYTY